MLYLLLAMLGSAAMSLVLKAFRAQKGNRYGIILGNYITCVLVGLLMMPDRSLLLHGSLTSAAAMGELRSGEAQRYYSEALERQTLLEDPSVEDCIFRPYQTEPYLLFFADMSEDPTSYENEDTASFYGKRSIVVSADLAD